MKFTKEDVLKLANLAKIELSETDQQRIRTTLGDVLDYVNKIGSVDTSEVDLRSDKEPVVRHDQVEGCDERVISRILSQFPERENDYLSVPEVFAGQVKSQNSKSKTK
jgi:aspartyl-tRNA(Asn)/glutamyl-tRNA(Gln) amidotransferase subunit C